MALQSEAKTFFFLHWFYLIGLELSVHNVRIFLSNGYDGVNSVVVYFPLNSALCTCGTVIHVVVERNAGEKKLNVPCTCTRSPARSECK